VLKKILLTGSSGFVGRHLLLSLNKCPDYITNCSVRNDAVGSDEYLIPTINSQANWSKALFEVDCVIHLAAVAHGKSESENIIKDFHEINVLGTLNLAKQAIENKVERFIFISSIGVNGSNSSIAFTNKDVPLPSEDYAKSKYEAELKLRDICVESQMELVIIRPPLVYGKDAPGNFGLLAKLVASGLPLPLLGINNKRSFVSVWNLVSLIETCISHEGAANNIFLVADGDDISTPMLFKKIAVSLGVSSRLFYCPSILLRLASIIFCKVQIYNKLFHSLEIDDSFTRNTLNWAPPLTLDEGLNKSFKVNS
jgi:nucleoside-diphosphate-sugar epimerase